MSNKDFSILKWVIFPPLVLGLSGGIGYFNVDVFGWRGSVLYLIALGAVNVSSLVMLKFSGSSKRPVRIAAFTIECLMIGVLVVNISYSLSAQRDLSLVRQDEESHSQAIEQISKLRGGRTQREALKGLGATTDVRSAFGQFEMILRVVMIAELSLALGGLFIVYGIAAIKPGLRRVPRHAFKGSRRVFASESPQVGLRGARGVVGFGQPVEASGSQMEANGSNVEAAWKQVEANSNLVLTGQDSGVRVRDGSRYLGHITWPDYRVGVSDPERPTESEIRSLLRSLHG